MNKITVLITLLLTILQRTKSFNNTGACCCNGGGCIDNVFIDECMVGNGTNFTVALTNSTCVGDFRGNDVTCADINNCVSGSSDSDSDSDDSIYSTTDDLDSSDWYTAAVFEKMNTILYYDTFITGYWQGYDIDGKHPFPLNQISTKINYIPIAFINPTNTSWKFMDGFYYTKDEIKVWINDINMRNTNQKVLFSICDSPDFHWYPDVNLNEFAKSIAKTVNEWNLGGINIDAESEMNNAQNKFVDTFIKLIKLLKKYLLNDKIITYTCSYNMNSNININYTYYHKLILKECSNDIEYMDTMNYWFDKKKQIIAYKYFANAIGDYNKVGIGVKAGNIKTDFDTTNIDIVNQCSKWLAQNNIIKQKRMMLWSVTRDIQIVTKMPNQTYFNVIYNNIKNVPQDLETKNTVLNVNIELNSLNGAMIMLIAIICIVNLSICYYFAKK